MNIADRWASPSEMRKLRRFAKALLNMRLSALFASRSPVDPRGARRSRTPLCNPDDALRRSCDASLGQAPAALPAIDLDPEGQVALWKAWRPFLRELALRRDRMPDPNSPMSAGLFGENIVLSCMLQHAKPRRFVAYGAPGAIATALGTMEIGVNQSMECIYLAPSPDLSSRVLRPADRPRIRIVPGGLAALDQMPSLFAGLDRGDILYIGSPQGKRPNSFNSYFILKVLPALKPGVIVRFGEIIHPFEHPTKQASSSDHIWNEVSALRAFLMYNREFQITFSSDYFSRANHDLVVQDVPFAQGSLGDDLWLTRRTSDQETAMLRQLD